MDPRESWLSTRGSRGGVAAVWRGVDSIEEVVQIAQTFGREIMDLPICKRYAAIVCLCLLAGAGGDGVLNVVFGAQEGSALDGGTAKANGARAGPQFR